MPEITIVVYGLPGPQGSKKDTGRRRTSKAGNQIAIMIESSKKVKPWRAAVAAAAEKVRPADVLDGAIEADVVFSMPRPKVHYRTGAHAGELKPSFSDAAPCVMPDLSKLLRSTEDALKGIIWADDGRVVRYGRLEKVYVLADDPDALDRPGARIRVRPFAPRSRERSANFARSSPPVLSEFPLFALAHPEEV